jgi:hypothetical protein
LGTKLTAAAIAWRDHVRFRTRLTDVDVTVRYSRENQHSMREFARRYFGAGKAEGRVEIVLRQLTTRYGQLSAAVAARVQGANPADLDVIAVLTAQTLDEALGTR